MGRTDRNYKQLNCDFHIELFLKNYADVIELAG